MFDVDISVGSSLEYENLIAEVKFGSIAGLIISKEPSDADYMISIHSFNGNSARIFDYNLNNSSEKLPLDVVISSIEKAVEQLKSLA